MLRLTFRWLTVLFACAAAWHLFACMDDAASARARHATFALIDGAVALLMVRRPRGFPVAFAFLCGQQLLSHGGALLGAWREGHVDGISLAVVVGMPLILGLLVVDSRARGRMANTSP